MKLLSLVLFSVLFLTLTTAGQSESCLFDLNQNRLRKSPGFVQSELAFNNQIKANAVFSPNSRSSAQSLNVATETIVEIPIVVHVIYKSSESNIGSTSNPSDDAIQNAINKLNNDYSGIGTASNSAKVPIRFVLAKRSPDCKSTTGINRIDGGSISGYNNYGLAYPASGFVGGASEQNIRALANWPPQQYYNIWIVWKIQSKADGTGNALGYAYSPFSNGISPSDGAFIKTGEMSSTATTLTHELGHALGLYHTFEGSSSSSCVANTDCSNTGDRVCDTDPVQPLNGTCKTDAEANTCNSNRPFNGIQRNFMGYSNCTNWFTNGQKDRMITTLYATRNSQINNSSLTAPSSTSISNSTQIPQNIAQANNNNNVGPCNINFGSLNYTSKGYTGDGFKYYKDNTCDLGTTLSPTQSQTITITTENSTQRCKAWIDFNNNGTLESNELILNSNNNGGAANYSHIGTITASQLANVSSTNKALRLRVMSDLSSSPDFNADSKLQYGQTEDFWVSINTSLNVVFGNLSATLKATNLHIAWNTESETNNEYFIIEGSKDGSHFFDLTTVKSKATNGSSDTSIQYSLNLDSKQNTLASISFIILAILFLGIAAKNKRKLVLATTIGVLFFVACNKQDTQTINNDNDVKFIRITQVDKDGVKTASKAVKIVIE